MEIRPIPNQEEVKKIYKYCYLLFTKYIDARTDEEFSQLVNDAREIRNKYPYKLCEVILFKNIDIINEYYQSWQRKENNNG